MVDFGKTTPRNAALRHFPIKTSGIYQIKNTTDGKVYIGSATDMRRRLRIHLIMLRKCGHISPHLQRAFNRDGEAAFVFEVLELCDRSQLLATEQKWLDAVRPFDDRIGYNTSSRADAGPVVVYTDEIRAAISARFKGKKHSKAHKRRISEALKGKTYSAETRKKISEGMKRFFSDPSNLEAHSQRFIGKPSGNKGRKHTAKARRNMSLARMGKEPSNKGKPMSEEQKLKLSLSKKGRPNIKLRWYSDETVKRWIQMKQSGMTFLAISFDERVHPDKISLCIKRYLKEHPEDAAAASLPPLTQMNLTGTIHARPDVTGESEAMDLSITDVPGDLPDER